MAAHPEKDFYSILDIKPEAPKEKIRDAYRRLALLRHPDKNPGDANACSAFQKLQNAYEILYDDNRRAVYDAGRKAARQASQRAPSWASKARDFGNGFREKAKREEMRQGWEWLQQEKLRREQWEQMKERLDKLRWEKAERKLAEQRGIAELRARLKKDLEAERLRKETEGTARRARQRIERTKRQQADAHARKVQLASAQERAAKPEAATKIPFQEEAVPDTQTRERERDQSMYSHPELEKENAPPAAAACCADSGIFPLHSHAAAVAHPFRLAASATATRPQSEIFAACWPDGHDVGKREMQLRELLRKKKEERQQQQQ